MFDALEALEREAADRGVSMAALALAWALAQPEVTAVVVGPTTWAIWSRRSRRSRSISPRPTATI